MSEFTEYEWRTRCLAAEAQRDLAYEEILHVKANLSAAEAERDALKGRALCSYCGHEMLRGIGTHKQFLEAIKTHVLTCDKRPEVAMAIELAEVEQARDQYKRESDALRAKLANVRVSACQLGDFQYGAVRECSQDMIRYIDEPLESKYGLCE